MSLFLKLQGSLKKSFYHWRVLLNDEPFKRSLFFGICLIFAAYPANYFASSYNDAYAYISIGDIILDNIPVYNMEFAFTYVVYGLLLLIWLYPILFRPELTPFALKTFAFLIFVRSGFILLTNLGPPVGFFYEGGRVGGAAMADILFKNDLFFSGHVAYPFLGFLIFKNTWVRWVLLAGSFFMVITVLAMHIHYSIDVFAAFFIAYGTYSVSEKIFSKLNARFKTKVKLYGWDAVQKMKKMGKDIYL